MLNVVSHWSGSTALDWSRGQRSGGGSQISWSLWLWLWRGSEQINSQSCMMKWFSRAVRSASPHPWTEWTESQEWRRTRPATERCLSWNTHTHTPSWYQSHLLLIGQNYINTFQHTVNNNNNNNNITNTLFLKEYSQCFCILFGKGKSILRPFIEPWQHFMTIKHTQSPILITIIWKNYYTS